MNNTKGQTEIIVVVAVTFLAVALLATHFFDLNSPLGRAEDCPVCIGTQPTCEGCTASTPSISVAWNSPNVVVTFSGQTGHLKKRVKGTTDWTNLNNGASPYYDSAVQQGITYEYSTFNSGDLYSAICTPEDECRWRCSITNSCVKASNTVEITVPSAPQVPNPITNLNAVPGSSPGQINLTWSAPASGPAPEYYDVTVNVGGLDIGHFTPSNPFLSYSSSIPPATGGVLHYFYVKACNSVGCSSAVTASSYPEIGVDISGPVSGQTEQALQFTATPQYAGSSSFAWTMVAPNPANCSFNNPNISNPLVTCSTAGSATIKVTLTANGSDTVIDISNFSITQSDSTPPVVAVTSPSSGALIKGTITVTANASDAGSGVDFVEFFVDSSTTALCTDSSAPYSCSWNTSSLNGSHSIKAKATDNAGNFAEDSVNVTIDNTNPLVSISSPVNGSTVSGTKTISASASDSGSGIANLKLYIDGYYKTIYYTSSFNYPWNTTTETNGSHSIKVVAEDNAGNIAQQIINVNVNNAVPQLGAEAGGPYSGTKQTVIQLNGQAVNAEGSASFLWEELSDSAGCTISFPASQNPTVSCTADSGSATLKLTVSASNGTATDTASVVITPVYNLSVNINGPYTATAGEEINLSALVEDSVGTVNYSWSILGCTPSSSIQSSPTVTCNSSSSVQLTVTADNGTANDTSTITITAQPDQTDPVVSITSHSNNQEVDAVEIIIATATDASGIKDVKFYVDNSLKSTDTSFPYEYSWNTADVSNGSHTLKVVAEDTAGNTAETTISLNVNNQSGPQCGDGVIDSGEECESDSDCFTASRTQCDYSTQKYGTRTITCSSCSCVVGYWNYSAKNSILYCDSCDSCKDNEEGNCNEDCQSSNIPDKPIGLDIVEVTEDSISIEWNPNTESDLKRYIIYYGKSSEKYDYEETALKNETSLTLTGLSSVTRYYIALTAVNLGGNESELSEEVTARTKEKELVIKTVAVPTGLKATKKDSKVLLEWDTVSPVDNYIVQRKKEGGYFEEIGAPETNSFEDTDIELGVKYYYRVSSFLDGKTSDFSEQVKVEFDEEKPEEDNLVEWSAGGFIVAVSIALTYILFTYDI